MVGRMVLPVVVESASARFFADLRTDLAVIASVDCTRVSVLGSAVCPQYLRDLAYLG